MYSTIKDINTFTAMMKYPTMWRGAFARSEPSPSYIVALYAQCSLETNFDDYKLLKHNNAFGMGVSVKRPRFHTGESVGVEKQAVYEDLLHSFMDRLNWDVWNKITFVSLPQYITQVVAQGYALDPLYAWKWRKRYEDIDWAYHNTGSRPWEAEIDLMPAAYEVWRRTGEVVENVGEVVADGAGTVGDKMMKPLKWGVVGLGFVALIAAIWFFKK